jgi:hypothetical protein
LAKYAVGVVLAGPTPTALYQSLQGRLQGATVARRHCSRFFPCYGG